MCHTARGVGYGFDSEGMCVSASSKVISLLVAADQAGCLVNNTYPVMRLAHHMFGVIMHPGIGRCNAVQ